MNNLSKNKRRIFIIITITLMSCFVCFLIYFNHYKDSKQIEYKYLGTFICGADVGDDATIVTLYASKKQTEKYDVAEKSFETIPDLYFYYNRGERKLYTGKIIEKRKVALLYNRNNIIGELNKNTLELKFTKSNLKFKKISNTPTFIKSDVDDGQLPPEWTY